jgi:hypothetical protein
MVICIAVRGAVFSVACVKNCIVSFPFDLIDIGKVQLNFTDTNQPAADIFTCRSLRPAGGMYHFPECQTAFQSV